MRATQIRPWPDLTELNPLLKGSEPSLKRGGGHYHIDFSQTYKADAVGIGVFIARLVQTKAAAPLAEFSTSLPKNDAITSKFISLNVGGALLNAGFEERKEMDLFSSSSLDASPQLSLWKSSDGDVLESLVCINPGKIGNRPEIILDVQRKIKSFLKEDRERSFTHEQVMIVLLEMVKNTIDHSCKPAVLGLKLVKSKSGGGRFSFSYSDTGVGVIGNIRNFFSRYVTSVGSGEDASNLTHKEIGQVVRLVKKGAMADILHWALQPGNSTKIGNGVNFGLGLMYIVAGSRHSGIRLLIKDADSMWVLTQLASPISHSEIRRYGVSTCSPPLLVYFGELDF